MKETLFALHSHADVWPRHSNHLQLAQQCHGDSYKFLKLLFIQTHPAFHPQPMTLITSYPTQGNCTLVQYHAVFIDYLQLVACIKNHESTLDSFDEIDVFINNTSYSDFFN